jgi:hypothetical protein
VQIISVALGSSETILIGSSYKATEGSGSRSTAFAASAGPPKNTIE